MKIPAFALFGLNFFLISGLNQPAQALPFKKTCSSMQQYFNAMKWKVPTSFSGFESSNMYQIEENLGLRNAFMCEGGFAVEKSPMGVKVCDKVTLFYDIGGNFAPVSWNNTRREGTCRYR